MTQSYDMFIDLLSPVFVEMGLEIIAEWEEYGVIMCMKGRNRFRAVWVRSQLCKHLVFLFLANMPSGPETLFLLTQEKTVYLSTIHFQGLQYLNGACQVNKTKSSHRHIYVCWVTEQASLFYKITQNNSLAPSHCLLWAIFLKLYFSFPFFPFQSFLPL